MPRLLHAGPSPFRALWKGRVESVLIAAVFLGASHLQAEALSSRPFALRSVSGGATRFTRLSPEQTGLVFQNRYSDPAMWGSQYQELVNGAFGTGLAVGDYDGDGRPDLFVNSKAEGSRLYRNLGDWRFEDVTEKSGLLAGPGGAAGKDSAGFQPWRQGAVFADVNNDGLPDLYVCRFAAPNLLFINQGGGKFREEASSRGLALVDASGVGAFCDYDRDGFLDLYVQTNMLDAVAHTGGQRDHLYHNRGDGTFEDVSDKAGVHGETCGHSVVWWDYDGDGWPDLYVANDFNVPDSLYRNLGDGTFSNVIASAVPRMPYHAMGSDSGDVNNDGFPDLLVTEMAATTHEKDLRGMANSRFRSFGNRLDVSPAPQAMNNMLYLNTGKGTFEEASFWAGLSSTDWTWSARFEDFDNDGWLDVHITNGMVRELNNEDMLKRSYTAASTEEGRLMVRNSPVMRQTSLAFKNDQGRGFQEIGMAWGLAEQAVSLGCVTGDFDGDGDMDLVYSRFDDGLSVWRNDSPSGNAIEVTLQGTGSNRAGVGSVVRLRSAQGRQMRTLTVARGYLSGSELIAHFGLGVDTIVDELEVTWPSGEVQRFKALESGKRYTVTESPQRESVPAVSPSPTLLTEIGESAGARLTFPEAPLALKRETPPVPFFDYGRGLYSVTGDVNGDGSDDLWVCGAGDAPGTLLLSAGARFISVPGPKHAAGGAGPVVVADLDGDGLQDFFAAVGPLAVSAAPGVYQPLCYRGDGRGGFSPMETPGFDSPVTVLAAADVDGDGKSDLFLGGGATAQRYPRGERSALWLGRSGRLEDAGMLLPAAGDLGAVRGAVFADLDRDGWPDLVVSTEWGQLRCLHNLAGKGFEDWTESRGFAAAGKGLWGPVAAGDLNGDGLPDFVVGNLGTNTPYRAAETKPLTLFVFDSTGTAPPFLLEASYEGDRLFTRRTRTELLQKIPDLLKRYPRNDLFARATIQEILGAERLKKVKVFEATELRQGVFLSSPEGLWRFEALAAEAQLAPIKGLALVDLDGDGKLDLVACQNTTASLPRNDAGAGLVMLGDGRGQFLRVSPARAGLVLAKEGQALAWVKRAGSAKPWLWVVQGGETLLFRLAE